MSRCCYILDLKPEPLSSSAIHAAAGELEVVANHRAAYEGGQARSNIQFIAEYSVYLEEGQLRRWRRREGRTAHSGVLNVGGLHSRSTASVYCSISAQWKYNSLSLAVTRIMKETVWMRHVL